MACELADRIMLGLVRALIAAVLWVSGGDVRRLSPVCMIYALNGKLHASREGKTPPMSLLDARDPS